MAIVAVTDDGIRDLGSGGTTLAGRDVTSVTRRPTGECVALVDDGHAVVQQDASGDWHELARVPDAARVVHATDGSVLVGTIGAHVLSVTDRAVQRLDAFDRVPGRERWENPAAGGRPDIWSFATCDGSVFVSVHVGGLWRSDDHGVSWTNVLEPGVDVHQVAARGGLVAVAAQGGFATSGDRGTTWSWTTEGLHADYMQSVALTDDAAYVGVSSGPFGRDAAVYRSSPIGAPFARRSDGIPDGSSAIGPYRLAADGEHLAAVPWSAPHVYVSHDAGTTWSRAARDVPEVHTLAVL